MSDMELFTRKLIQIAIVQISEELGNSGGLRQSSLNLLSEIVERFIQEIGSLSASTANASGRTDVNYFDVESALNDIGYTVRELREWENTSYPIPSTIDLIEHNTNKTDHENDSNNHDNHNDNKNDDENDENFYERHRIKELEQLIANNEFTQNGTVIFDSQTDIFQIIENKSKNVILSMNANKNKKQSANREKRKGMKHIPELCPDFPHNLLLKHTPIYYKPFTAHEAESSNETQIRDQKIKETQIEKTRKMVIEHSSLFKSYNKHSNNNEIEIDHNGIGNGNGNIVMNGNAHIIGMKRKINEINGHKNVTMSFNKKQKNNKNENVIFANSNNGNVNVVEEAVDIIPNPYVTKK